MKTRHTLDRPVTSQFVRAHAAPKLSPLLELQRARNQTCRPHGSWVLALYRALGSAPDLDHVPSLRFSGGPSLSRRCLWYCLFLIAMLGAAFRAAAQTGGGLPVYHVDQFGTTPVQARLLADAMNIPPNQLIVSNGLATFIDPTNYLSVPTQPVVDPAIVQLLLGQTPNESPGIPIQIEQIDFGALATQTVLDPGVAMQVTSNALAGAGLTPQFGAPSIGHATFTAFYSNSVAIVASNSVSLDTEVSYQFMLPGGYPLEGPGAQVQFDYGQGTTPTRILYGAPQLSPGPTVQTIPMAEALAKAGNLIDPTHVLGTLNLQGSTVYRLPHCLPCVAGPIFVLPWVKVIGSTLVTNPLSGDVSTLDFMPVYIPGTDDPAFVPQVNLTASSVGNTQVVAQVDVAGGMPPYSFNWSGSSPALNGANGPSIGYGPMVRATVPPLELEMIQALHAVLIKWWQPDPVIWATGPYPQPWVLETTPDLSLGALGWSQVNNPITTSNGFSSVTVGITGPHQFFRLRLAQSTVQVMETVAVTITDANGVEVQASQAVPVQAMVETVAPPGAAGGAKPQIVGIVDWGTESPYDPGLGTTDRNDWRTGMIIGGAGVERFLWTDTMSWKEDFIDSPAGINNWEVDNADITLYIGHGNPFVFTFTGGPGPSPTTLFYNQATKSWGNNDEEWLALLSCEVLEFNSGGLNVWQRWGPNFDGLHTLLGFSSLAYAGTGFPFSFAANMLNWPFNPFATQQTIVQAWFNAAHSRGTGTPAAMGPIGPGGAWDYYDYFWGKGPVGPTIRASQIYGWWYLSY
jgi:hypothetical protein